MQPDQSHRHQSDTDSGFTAVVCRGPACDRLFGEASLAGLRECVRRNPHGMLVSSGCLLGRLSCHALTADGPLRPGGPLLVVQRCAPDRRPLGPALWIGPLSDADDLAAVCRWLDAGELHLTALPVRLRFRAVMARRGATN